MLDGMSSGTAFKFSFLVGIFLANVSRAVVMLCDWIYHATSKNTADEYIKSSTTIALSGLPTLFLMSSFSIFIFYFAQVTI